MSPSDRYLQSGHTGRLYGHTPSVLNPKFAHLADCRFLRWIDCLKLGVPDDCRTHGQPEGVDPDRVLSQSFCKSGLGRQFSGCRPSVPRPGRNVMCCCRKGRPSVDLYTNPGRTRPQEKEHLPAERAKPIRQLVLLEREQQVELLNALFLGMGFGSPSGDSRKRRYLKEQAARHEKRVAELDALQGLATQLPIVFVLHAIRRARKLPGGGASASPRPHCRKGYGSPRDRLPGTPETGRLLACDPGRPRSRGAAGVSRLNG